MKKYLSLSIIFSYFLHSWLLKEFAPKKKSTLSSPIMNRWKNQKKPLSCFSINWCFLDSCYQFISSQLELNKIVIIRLYFLPIKYISNLLILLSTNPRLKFAPVVFKITFCLFQICEEAFKKAGEQKQVYHKHWLDSPWSGFFEGKNPLKVKKQTIL